MTSRLLAPTLRSPALRHGRWWIAVLSWALAACSSDEPTPPQNATQRCNEAAAVECAKLYACFNQQERFSVGLYPNQDGCTAQLSVNLNCSSATATGVCKGVGTLDETAQCIQQAKAVSCEQLRANITSLTGLLERVSVLAPKCVPCLAF